MRYIAYGLAIFAAVLTVAFTANYLPRDATASHSETNDTMNVLHLEETSNAKGLPRQEILDATSHAGTIRSASREPAKQALSVPILRS